MSGNDLCFGGSKRIRLPAAHRNSHLYVCGASRTGKSKFLEYLIRQDISNRWRSGCGLLLLDWHGSLYDNLMKWLGWHDLYRELPIVPIDLRRDDYVVSYHLLRQRKEAFASVVVGNILQDLAYVWGQGGTNGTPRFARIAGNLLHVLYEHKLTLAEVRILLEQEHTPLKIRLTESVADKNVRQQWRALNALKPEKAEEYMESSTNRFQRFIDNPLMCAMFGQSEHSLDLRKALDEGQIVLINLSGGEGNVTLQDAKTFATLILSGLWTDAQQRDKVKNPKPFYVYLDEFQEFITPTLAANLDQAGGFGLHLIMAHQFPSQLLDCGAAGQKVYNSIMANAATKVVFRTAHQADLDPLARELFMGVFDPDEVKHVLESTKVLDYEDDSRIVTTTTSGESDGDVAPKYDVEAEDPSSSEYGSLSHTESQVETETEQHFLRPVLGKEVSSIQYRPLEEQLHRAMAQINGLRRRHCISRLAETSQPVSFKTTDVVEGTADAKRVAHYTKSMLKKWKFVLPFEKARENVKLREKQLNETFLAKPDGQDEPKQFRRRIK